MTLLAEVERMNEQDKQLATALRDLCGWHPGMMLRSWHLQGRGGVVTSIEEDCLWVVASDGQPYAWGLNSSNGLPDLDSPANWGHWLEWCWMAREEGDG